MARFYPRDDDQLAAYWTGRMSLRRLRVLVQNLPPESATQRRLRGDPWGPSEHLIADVFDAVQMTGFNLMRVQGAKPRKPKAHPRPSDEAKRKQGQIGGRGEHSQEETLAFIQARKPPTASAPALDPSIG